MKVREKKWIRYRIYLVTFCFLVAFGIILFRAYQLQILEKDKLAAIARAGYRGIVKLPPKRGTIYDREGHELAVSIEVESIFAHPGLVKEKAKTSRQLSAILDIPRGETLSLLKKNSAFVWIKRRLSPAKVKRVKALGLEGIGFTKETRRYYPGRDIAGQLLGFTGVDNQGLEGLEKKYDGLLRGPEHTLVQMKDALKRPFFISSPTSYTSEMHDLILTIDKDIQYKAQQALQSAVNKAKAKHGQCIILNPETGEILAMAVVPSFNPNIFRQYQPYRWRNRTITDCYEPGSTIKAFLLASVLEDGIVSPRTLFDCEGGRYQVADHIIHDTKVYDSLCVADIIVFSSNIGAVKIGEKIGYERFSGYLRRFGFGSKTGIDLIGERKGFIRPIEKAREVDQATIFFGQGMSSSSLQIATAMAAIANGGRLMRPYIVSKVLDQAGRVTRETHPHEVRRVLTTSTAARVGRILRGVVGEKGTGPLAAIDGYPVAGKTGTSQKVDPRTKQYSKKNYVALFVGFVPVDKPELVILVMIDEPKGKFYGGFVAGPVFQEVGAWALRYLGVNPQSRVAMADAQPEKNDAGDSAFNYEPESRVNIEGFLPDFRGQSMREVLVRGKSLGLRIVLEGTGRAIRQIPKPGASLEGITTIRVKFRPPQ